MVLVWSHGDRRPVSNLLAITLSSISWKKLIGLWVLSVIDPCEACNLIGTVAYLCLAGDATEDVVLIDLSKLKTCLRYTRPVSPYSC